MPVEAISNATSSAAPQASALSQQDFIKLFLTELQYQDPTEPINNREFLAQMAQFTNLEQTRQISDGIGNLSFMSSTAQSVSLLGTTVSMVADGSASAQDGVVSAVNFTSTGPMLDITKADGTVVSNIKLSQVARVKK